MRNTSCVMLAVMALCMFACADGHAVLIDQGITTYDPLSGLQWLDVELTAGLSYNDVVIDGAGGWYANGYRHAFCSEIETLWEHCGFVPSTSYLAGSEGYNHMMEYIQLTSCTDQSSNCLIQEGMYVESVSGCPLAIAHLQSTAAVAVSCTVEYSEDTRDPNVGHYLVREHMNGIPEVASTLTLLILSVSGLVLGRRLRA